MTDLNRYYVTDGDLARWVVAGPAGAITLDTALGMFTGLFVHSRTDRLSEGFGEFCHILSAECWSDALGQDLGRQIFALRDRDAWLYDRLEVEYRREWPKSVPKAEVTS